MPAHDRPMRKVVKLEMKRKPPSQSTRRSFSLSDVLTVSKLMKRSTVTNPIPQNGRFIQKAHLHVAFWACRTRQTAFSNICQKQRQTYEEPSKKRTEDGSDRPGYEDERKPLRPLSQGNNVSEDDLSAHDDAATTDALDTAPCEKEGEFLCHSTED